MHFGKSNISHFSVTIGKYLNLRVFSCSKIITYYLVVFFSLSIQPHNLQIVLIHLLGCKAKLNWKKEISSEMSFRSALLTVSYLDKNDYVCKIQHTTKDFDLACKKETFKISNK